jgi:hypothetical protein
MKKVKLYFHRTMIIAGALSFVWHVASVFALALYLGSSYSNPSPGDILTFWRFAIANAPNLFFLSFLPALYFIAWFCRWEEKNLAR